MSNKNQTFRVFMYFEADFFSGEDTWNLPLSKALSQLLL